MVSCKKLFGPVLGLFAFISDTGEPESKKYLTIETKSGKKFSFAIPDNPMISFRDGSLILETSSSLAYSVDNVKGYQFSENRSSFPEMLSDVIRVFSSRSNMIQLMGVPPFSDVAVCSENGAVRDYVHSDAEGRVCINDRYSTGTYWVTIGNKSFQLIKK